MSVAFKKPATAPILDKPVVVEQHSKTIEKEACPASVEAVVVVPVAEANVSADGNSVEQQPAVAEKKKPKKKKKESDVPAIKRTITSKTLRKFTEKELRDGLQFLIDKKLIPKRTDLGSVKKLSKDMLIKYCKPWATANFFQAVLQQKEYREKNAPSLTKMQRKIIHKLKYFSAKNILLCIKDQKLDIKNTYSMKKDELCLAIALSEKAKDVLDAVRALERRQEQDREEARQKELSEKKSQEQSSSASSSEEEGESSSDTPPRKSKKRSNDSEESDHGKKKKHKH